MRRFLLAVGLLLAMASNVFAATAVATYRFNSTLAADQLGAPALTKIDPLGLSGFENDTVLGAMRPVWRFEGNENPTNQQAGFTINTAGLVASNGYSVDLVFEFTQRDGAWRRIIDVENRQSDNGFYVNPQNNLHVFPISGSTSAWTNNVYHHVVLTNNGGTVAAYIDGVSQFSTNTAIMNIQNANNPNLLMGFFIDNVILGGQQEFSDGRVAFIRLWNGVLSSDDAHAVANDPFVDLFRKGDFNRDGLVNADDIPAMLQALTDLNGYKSSKGISDEHLAAIGDFTNDNKVTNADIQPFLDTFAGGGSISPVPEPAGCVLVASALGVFAVARRRGRGR
jgi:hypothetical protein